MLKEVERYSATISNIVLFFVGLNCYSFFLYLVMYWSSWWHRYRVLKNKGVYVLVTVPYPFMPPHRRQCLMFVDRNDRNVSVFESGKNVMTQKMALNCFLRNFQKMSHFLVCPNIWRIYPYFVFCIWDWIALIVEKDPKKTCWLF